MEHLMFSANFVPINFNKKRLEQIKVVKGLSNLIFWILKGLFSL